MNKVAKGDMLFLSHASEDNDFTKWLALKLACFGYGVWCDLTKLLGGENWPKEINIALQRRTTKFIFILSRKSNLKDDPLNELESARNIMKTGPVQDSEFIIPLRIEKIPQGELDFRLLNIQWIDFCDGWAKGLSRLLNKLEKCSIEKKKNFDPNAVNIWWCSEQKRNSQLVIDGSKCSSNCFKFDEFPSILWYHVTEGLIKDNSIKSLPILTHSEGYLSFHNDTELKRIVSFPIHILESIPIATSEIVDGTTEMFHSASDARNHLIELLNKLIEKKMIDSNLFEFNLSNSTCYYFHEGILDTGRIQYRPFKSISHMTKLWGKRFQEKWHLALDVRTILQPQIHYRVKPHILLSSEGNASEMNVKAASSSIYKSWHNPEYRDRIQSALFHLSQGELVIPLLKDTKSKLILSAINLKYKSSIDFYD